LPPGAADPPNFVSVERPEDLGLGVERQIPDLVQKQGTALGVGERALAPDMSAGERPTLVAE